MAAGCPFITCAVKRRQIEFCWQCEESEKCQKWRKHREAGRKHDSFVCYQRLEDNLAFIQRDGLSEFEKVQKTREKWLKKALQGFNEGRSKTYYSIAATVMQVEDLETALSEAASKSEGLERSEKSKQLHGLLDEIAERTHCLLKLRK